MTDWSWVLAVTGTTGMWVSGRRIWWGWCINLANEMLWVIYAIVTAQPGFILMAFGYSAVYLKNAVTWRRSAEGRAFLETRQIQ